MKAILNWIDERSGLATALRTCSDAPVPGGARWSKVWPCTILFGFCVQAITGFFLWMYYSPSAQTAWESVYFLQYDENVVGGWLLRAVHHYSAQVLLVLVGVYLIQMILLGTYRAPRELVFLVALFMGLFTLGLLLTGDLLSWDQNSFAATQQRVGFLTMLPGVGEGLYKLAAGGSTFGHLTLTRFLALHVGLFAGGFLVLLILHGLVLRRAEAAEAEASERVERYWPRQTVRGATACLVVLAVILLLACQHGVSGDRAGVPLGSPADPDPANFYSDARPEWAFRGLYEFSTFFPGEFQILRVPRKILAIFVIPGLLVCVFLAMPWIGRRRGGHRFNVGLTAALLIAIVALSLVSVAKDRADEEHQAAIAVENEQAERVRQLARGPERIPSSGALTLLRNDPKTQGPKLFEAHCAGCHDYADAEGEPIKAEKSSAPNLYGFATREWLAGLLDPEQVKGADYFGNTKLRNGQMADFVEEMFSDLEEDEQAEVETIAMAISAEARLRSQTELDVQDAPRIEQGKAFVVDDFGCCDCHKFHGEGSLGDAPDLTGYGSREWIAAVISNPADKRFYGKRNDRMPAYAELPDDSLENTLRARDVDLLTDWLRGEWYEQ